MTKTIAIIIMNHLFCKRLITAGFCLFTGFFAFVWFFLTAGLLLLAGFLLPVDFFLFPDFFLLIFYNTIPNHIIWERDKKRNSYLFYYIWNVGISAAKTGEAGRHTSQGRHPGAPRRCST